jgi:hypothetical protein
MSLLQHSAVDLGDEGVRTVRKQERGLPISRGDLALVCWNIEMKVLN